MRRRRFSLNALANRTVLSALAISSAVRGAGGMVPAGAGVGVSGGSVMALLSLGKSFGARENGLPPRQWSGYTAASSEQAAVAQW
ncbi:hypothetical protein [Brevundimonas sp. TWP2-3-2]|uniref:hypothetical protein n=1 Tax=unclassified Brevundimonas TaxID=2622653 RepID=UPI003CEAD8A6